MTAANDRELTLTRLIDAPREKVFRCWTEPSLMVKWFAPKPWSTPRAETDPRAGGKSLIVMADPDGNEFPNEGVYLEVVPNEKIVFTDAFTDAWFPSEKPFFVGIITLADENGKTRYTAMARHWTKEDCDAHEKMGFHEGWGQCAAQMEEVAKTL
ncbi:SRPBCC family protein [Arvimicrobium flavum]|uniref:SRPBCC family protein n=1 Tax=Arvimicrobium flavum TaxID=3393320 RepID=UPI00237B8182|nr:SRPBCC family protein [Mesorhizobium shangrilense]